MAQVVEVSSDGPRRRLLSGTELVMVRHGQGTCNADGVIGGRLGCGGLSHQGRRQSVRLARRLAVMHADRPFDVLLCSPRRRVVESAAVIGFRLGMPLTAVEALRGQEFGAADGRPWQDVFRAFGGPPAHAPDRAVAAGAEPWNDYADRVLAALTEVLAEHAGRRILVVAHGRTAGLAAALVYGAADPRVAAVDLVTGHGTISRLTT